MKKLIFFSLCLLLVAPAMAVVRVGNFQVELVGPEEVYWDSAQNDGYNNGTWYEYEQPAESEPPPPWWNEWWWNDPWLDPGGKWVRIKFDYQLLDPAVPGDVMVTMFFLSASKYQCRAVSSGSVASSS